MFDAPGVMHIESLDPYICIFHAVQSQKAQLSFPFREVVLVPAWLYHVYFCSGITALNYHCAFAMLILLLFILYTQQFSVRQGLHFPTISECKETLSKQGDFTMHGQTVDLHEEEILKYFQQCNPLHIRSLLFSLFFCPSPLFGLFTFEKAQSHNQLHLDLVGGSSGENHQQIEQ